MHVWVWLGGRGKRVTIHLNVCTKHKTAKYKISGTVMTKAKVHDKKQYQKTNLVFNSENTKISSFMSAVNFISAVDISPLTSWLGR